MLCIIFASLISHYLTVLPQSIYIPITQHNERRVKIRPHFNTLRMDSGCARIHINSLIEANEKKTKWR